MLPLFTMVLFMLPFDYTMNINSFVHFSQNYIFGSSTTYDRSMKHPKFDPTGVQTHDL